MLFHLEIFKNTCWKYEKKILDEKSVYKKWNPFFDKKVRKTGFIQMVEAGGIEPPSENTSTQVSPSAVCLLGFPSRTAGKQAMRYGILWYTSSPKEKAEGVHH